MASEALILLFKVNAAASAAILGVLVLRGVMRRKFGARVGYALWLAVPAVAIASLLPARVVEIAASGVQPASIPQAATVEHWLSSPRATGQFLDLSLILAAIWIVGVVAALTVLASRQVAFLRVLGKLRHEGEGVLRSAATGVGPAIVGAVRPKIILPGDFESRFDADERELVLAHERSHLRGRDPAINGLVALSQCLNWFNPLMHIAANAMRVDQELACDAAVMAQFPKVRRRYAEAILKTQIASAGLPLGCYWPARGQHPLKMRIAMLKQGAKTRGRVLAGVAFVALACLTSGCMIWAVQPERQVEARVSAVPPEQARLNERLMRAILRGDARAAEKAIASGADANARARDGSTALVITARMDHFTNLKLLLKHGADPNLISPGEGHALMAAARRGHLRSVVALVEHGAKVDAIAPRFGTPLAAAARTQEFGVLKYLVEHGADVNLSSPLPAPWDYLGGPRTPLEIAINNGDAQAIAYLKSKGAKM